MHLALSIVAALVSFAVAAPQAPVSSSGSAPGTTAPAAPTAAAPAHNTLHYTATYTPGSIPHTTETGQYGYNDCGTVANQTSLCQNLYVNSVDDFCLFGPPQPNSQVGATEEIQVAWCLQGKYGTRLIPDGTISGAHFVMTPDYVQVTGVGDFTKMNIQAGDQGGELDPHGATGNGNPIGGLVFGNSYGTMQQYHEWTNFMAADQFCIRACNPAGPNPAGLCQHIYDLQGCAWNMPANYNPGVFEDCLADSALPMGVYGTSTFQQGNGPTPPPHPIPSSSSCSSLGTVTALTSAVTSSSASATTTFTASGATGSSSGVKATATTTKSGSLSIVASAPILSAALTGLGVVIGMVVAL